MNDMFLIAVLTITYYFQSVKKSVTFQYAHIFRVVLSLFQILFMKMRTSFKTKCSLMKRTLSVISRMCFQHYELDIYSKLIPSVESTSLI